jgi:TFIIF-interacting CTD phosphatase-like protein
MNLLAYIKFLPVPDIADLKDKMVEFGDYTRHKTLIWDMDETLVHTSLLMPDQDTAHNIDFTVTLKNGTRFGVAIRPYAIKCLEHLSQFYEMAIFTAAD